MYCFNTQKGPWGPTYHHNILLKSVVLQYIEGALEPYILKQQILEKCIALIHRGPGALHIITIYKFKYVLLWTVEGALEPHILKQCCPVECTSTVAGSQTAPAFLKNTLQPEPLAQHQGKPKEIKGNPSKTPREAKEIKRNPSKQCIALTHRRGPGALHIITICF